MAAWLPTRKRRRAQVRFSRPAATMGSMPFASPLFLIPLWAFIFLISFATALMEIQIEGGNGWAKLLPSWRFAPPWLKRILNGKDITGYHVYLNLHSILMLHFPVLFLGWSWQTELTILFVLSSFVVCEDVLWFILNPHFGWFSFTREKVSWYTSWLGPLPSDYYFWILLSVLFAVLRGTLTDAPGDRALGVMPLPLQHLFGWLLGLGVFLVCTTMLGLLVTPRIRRFLETDTRPHPGHPVKEKRKNARRKRS
jgi:hypothetical protein